MLFTKSKKLTHTFEKLFLTEDEYHYVEQFVRANSDDVLIVVHDQCWCDAASQTLVNVKLEVNEEMLIRLGAGAFLTQLNKYVECHKKDEEKQKAKDDELKKLREKVNDLKDKLSKKVED